MADDVTIGADTSQFLLQILRASLAWRNADGAFAIIAENALCAFVFSRFRVDRLDIDCPCRFRYVLTIYTFNAL